MRFALPVLLLGVVLALGVSGRASAHDEDAAALVDRRLQAAELRIEYLLRREKAVSDYILRNQDRSAALVRGLARARSEGFAAAAISSTSREALLSTLEAVAADLGKDLPEVVKEQAELLKKADAANR
jgi:hypothetical protein